MKVSCIGREDLESGVQRIYKIKPIYSSLWRVNWIHLDRFTGSRY